MGFLYRIFLKGLLTLLPIFLTIYLLVWATTRAESAFGEPLRSWFPTSLYFPGAGVAVVILLTFLVGILVNHYLTQWFFEWIEGQLQKTPVIRSIYSPLRDVTQLFARKDENSSAQKVVMVKLDALGVEAMGLMTRDDFRDLPGGMIPDGSCAVFVPFSYGVGGFTVIVPKSQLRETNLPADRAMQLAITGWIKASKP